MALMICAYDILGGCTRFMEIFLCLRTLSFSIIVRLDAAHPLRPHIYYSLIMPIPLLYTSI